MSEVKKKRVSRKDDSLALVQKIDGILRDSYKEYHETNKELLKYAGRTLQGQDFKDAEALVIKMHTIYTRDMEPIVRFVTNRSSDAVSIAHAHNEWVRGNQEINKAPSIITPGGAH